MNIKSVYSDKMREMTNYWILNVSACSACGVDFYKRTKIK